MLNLAYSTPKDWGRRALEQMDDILLDHAHCEKKAASTALTLIFRYPHYTALALPLSELAREELEHFEQVVHCMRRHGLQFRHQKPSSYAGRLLEARRDGNTERFIDTMICCALIEARSCERMTLIANALEERLQDPSDEIERAQTQDYFELYRGLIASEARHHRLYLDLIRKLELIHEDELRLRLSQLATHEGSLFKNSPATPDRMHI